MVYIRIKLSLFCEEDTQGYLYTGFALKKYTIEGKHRLIKKVDELKRAEKNIQF